jgi:hypothetical protein
MQHLPFLAQVDFELVRLTDSDGYPISSRITFGDWLWDTQDYLSTGATMVPVICASAKSHLTNYSDAQHSWLLYVIMANFPRDIRHTPKTHAWILVQSIPCPLKSTKNIDEPWHSAV